MDRSLMDSPFQSLSDNLNLSSKFQSPFLQVDPSVAKPSVKLSPEFIFPDGSSKSSRGRFEMAFSQIGGSIITGAGIGGSLGLIKGLREASAMNDSLIVKRTHLLNYITRNGTSMANTFGTISLLYSVIGVGLSFVQDENDDLNTLLAATSTGLIYGASTRPKSIENLQGSTLKMMRIKRASIGFTVGLVAASGIIFLLNKSNPTSHKFFN